jgi:hypothetical protein
VLLLLQNEDAEELMRQVEREEEATAAADPEGLQLHLCIINLVIGTLYCSKVRWLVLWHMSCCARPRHAAQLLHVYGIAQLT